MGVAQFAAGQRVRALDLNQLPVVVSYLSTGTGGASSTAEVVIGTFTIPAGDPTLPGGYFWKVSGVCAEAAAPTITVRLRLNSLAGTQLTSGSGTFSGVNGIFQYEGWIGMEALGSSGSFASFNTVAVVLSGSPSSHIDQIDGVAINTTISNTLVVTAQFSASNASNSATTKFGALYRL